MARLTTGSSSGEKSVGPISSVMMAKLRASMSPGSTG